MPPLKGSQKKAVVKETRTPEEIAIQSAANSSHHIMIPMLDAAYVRLKNPLTGLDHHFSTNDPAFFNMYYDLAKKGLEAKLMKDLSYFAEHYDAKWNNVIDAVNGYFKSKELLNNN
jgi:hypothetical protein